MGGVRVQQRRMSSGIFGGKGRKCLLYFLVGRKRSGRMVEDVGGNGSGCWKILGHGGAEDT